MKVSMGYRNSKGDIVHDVYFDNEECFKEIKNINKCNNCSLNNCKYYPECSEDKGVVRICDCKKNQNKIKLLYNLITGAIVFALTIIIFFIFNYTFLKGSAILIFFLVILDVLCTFVESTTPKFLEVLFYNKLKSIVKKAEKENEKKEQREKAKEMDKISKNPQYKKVIDAETFVKKLKKFCKENDFGESKKKIEKCIERLTEIIKRLKKDCTSYSRVAFLFEVYLPEFYDALKYYSTFAKAKAVKNEHEEVLKKCVEKFLKFLNSQRIEAVFDKDSTEIKFKATAETLGKMIDKGEEIYEKK